MKKKKVELDPIERVLNYLRNCTPGSTKTSQHILVWNTSQLPYQALETALDLISRIDTIVRDFDFYCRAHGGDAVGWQVTLHIKELDPKP
jgi:hypothetical protein